MKVSVVLTTYNGMRYLTPLLDSLKDQTRKIDEVLICDDGSNDGTRDYVSEYIEKNGLTGWILRKNEENFGWMKNFRVGIQQCSGDVVFPCDQDDVWKPNKVECMCSVMENNKDILLLSSDYEPLYEEGSVKVDEPNKEKHSDKLEHIPFDKKFAQLKRPGCVMAIRKELIDKTRDIWEDWYPHDAFLWSVSCIFNGCYLYHEPLICFRRHDSNASTGMQHTVKAQANSLKRTQRIAKWRIEQKEPLTEKEATMLKKYTTFAELRLGMIEERKIFNWFKMIPYSGYYRSFRQQLGDWYYVLKRK